MAIPWFSFLIIQIISHAILCRKRIGLAMDDAFIFAEILLSFSSNPLIFSSRSCSRSCPCRDFASNSSATADKASNVVVSISFSTPVAETSQSNRFLWQKMSRHVSGCKGYHLQKLHLTIADTLPTRLQSLSDLPPEQQRNESLILEHRFANK